MTNDGIRPGRRAAQGRPDALEEELLRRLGLGIDTTPEQLEATHEAVVAFLAQAPRSLRAWARANAAAADEAYALLLDPVALARSAAAAERSPVAPPQRAEPTEPSPSPAGARDALPHGRRAPRDRMPAAVPTPDDELDELIAEVTPSAHRDEVAHPVATSRPPTLRRFRPGFARASVGVVALAAVVVIGFVVYHAGAPDTLAASAPTASAVASPALDQAQVAALMEKIKANPNDTDALMSLGDAFFQSGQYDVAADWLARLVTIDPKNQRALLALGAAEFNAGDAKDAETHWKQVLTLDATSVEAHYDLGFLYLQQQPPDLAGVKREWQRVVELAPGTEVAQNVQAHLDAIASQDPSASPGASGSQDPSASPTAPQR